MTVFSPIFLSHGAPNMALHDTPVRGFMKGFGNQVVKPDAIVAVSAHFEAKGATIVSDPNPNTVYDFRGFEQELYDFKYPAPGQPELASEIGELLADAKIPFKVISKRGFDHGIWVPLSLVWPDADIPIVQLSIDPEEGADYHFRLGKALRNLPGRNIAVIATGNITHNLPALFNKGVDANLDANIKYWVEKFLEWFDSELESGNTDNVLNYRENAPFAEENHPTDEHLLPIFVAIGAAGENWRGRKLHASYTHDFLAMDAWSFTSA